jgi:hypothetical protein
MEEWIVYINRKMDNAKHKKIAKQVSLPSLCQGCHKGRFWMKMSVRTSFSSGRPFRPDVRGRRPDVRARLRLPADAVLRADAVKRASAR